MILPAAAQVGGSVNVLTYQYDNSRAGANRSEAILTPANVNQRSFGKLFSAPVDGYLYGQPLYLGGVTVAGQGVHNLVYVATEHDSVYAFDADAAGPPLWHVSFLNAATGVTSVPAADTSCSQIEPELGITSTPVIDPQSGTLYVVAMTKETSAAGINYVHRLHALDVTSGAERPGSPAVIQATYPGTGEHGTLLTFVPRNYKQRPGLLLLNGVVYTAWSSHCDIGQYHGWLMAYDAHTLQQVGVYNNTPDGNQGSFWAGGAAPAADAAGNIYLSAGNGTFDYESGGRDLGESYIKLSSSGALTVADYFAPFDFGPLNNADVDVGSAGVALLPDEAGSVTHPHLMVGGGKEGRIYVLDRDNFGHWQSASDSQVVASLPVLAGGVFGNPAYFNKSVYFCGNVDYLRAFSLADAILSPTPRSLSAVKFGFACTPTVSANGNSNGVVWILEVAGILRAYDASNLATELYNSSQNSSRDALGAYVKFTAPMVANGKVYAGTQTALAVYGLLAPAGPSVTIKNPAGGPAGVAAPGSIISIFGSALASSSTGATGYPLSPALAGSSVTVNGLPAPLYYVSASQINAQVPFETPIGGVSLTVTSGGAVAGSALLVVQSTAPGLFVSDALNHVAALNQDGTVNSDAHPASPGDALAVYLTGLGAVDNAVATGAAATATPLSRVTAAVTASIGAQQAQVLFAGLAPGFAGLYQVNILVPQLAPGAYPVQITAGGRASNLATVSMH
jgi:uncharacterized protein (TIGR03437 family)